MTGSCQLDTLYVHCRLKELNLLPASIMSTVVWYLVLFKMQFFCVRSLEHKETEINSWRIIHYIVRSACCGTWDNVYVCPRPYRGHWAAACPVALLFAPASSSFM